MSFVPPSQRPPSIFSSISSYFNALNPLNTKKEFQSHIEKQRFLEMRRFRMKIFTIAGGIAIISGLQLFRFYFGDESSRINEQRHPMLQDDAKEVRLLKEELRILKSKQV